MKIEAVTLSKLETAQDGADFQPPVGTPSTRWSS